MDDFLMPWITLLCGLSFATYFGARVVAQIRELGEVHNPLPHSQSAIFARFMEVTSGDTENAEPPDMLEEEFQELERNVAARTAASNGTLERQAQCSAAYG